MEQQERYAPGLTLESPLELTTKTITFYVTNPQPKMMVMFGLADDKPMITVFHGDNEPIVELWRDGTCSIKNEHYLDAAARTFYKAVATCLKEYQDRPGFVVRKVGVSEYYQADEVGINWVQTVHEATHFARERDAMAACRSGDDEVVPTAEAHLFTQLRSLA